MLSSEKKTKTARTIVERVLESRMTRELWTSNYEKAIPVSVQDFDLSAVLPAVFYMFRFGHRRGKGKFLDTFVPQGSTSGQRRGRPTVKLIAEKLSQSHGFEGFDSDMGRAILADLLLAFCLENKNRALGRDEQVQRVAPAHYLASWVDLPDAVANLRYVPEMLVALLADQNHKRSTVAQSKEGERTWFAVGRGFERNVLLQAFAQGMRQEGPLADRKGDRFDEHTPVGLDQLLMVRLAQQLGEAPDKLRGESAEISNQRPIAERAARHFSEDIRRFVRGYAGEVPRHTLVELLESCMAVGLTAIVTSVIEVLFHWTQKGEVPKKSDQRPTLLFVDCSNGVNRQLRARAEECMDDFFRRLERLPVILMALRLLGYSVRNDSQLRREKFQDRPYATEWVNFLGDLLFERRKEARGVLDYLDRKANELANDLKEEYPEAAQMLDSKHAEPHPVWRLAETLTYLQGRKNTVDNVVSLVDSSLLMNRPNGLGARRFVTRQVIGGEAARSRDVRSLVFTDAVLDYLVHLHVLPGGDKTGYRPLALRDFLHTLVDRYGFCVEVAPPGMLISSETLRANRGVLEKRLRDLGLLVGVNDAEAMKHLRPRFGFSEELNDMD